MTLVNLASSMIQKKSHFKAFAMVSHNTSGIVMDKNILMSSGVETGHVIICMHAVTAFGHVLMDEMKIVAVEQYALHKRMLVYLLSILQ